MHHRTVDTLGKMLRAGTITQEMHDAAKDFQAAFIIANLDPLRALPILRVPGTGREPDLNERQLDARRRVHKAMQALGGISSPAGSLRLARRRPAAERARVGDAPGLGRAAGAAGAGAGHPGGGAGGAGGALRVRRGQAGPHRVRADRKLAATGATTVFVLTASERIIWICARGRAWNGGWRQF